MQLTGADAERLQSALAAAGDADPLPMYELVDAPRSENDLKVAMRVVGQNGRLLNDGGGLLAATLLDIETSHVVVLVRREPAPSERALLLEGVDPTSVRFEVRPKADFRCESRHQRNSANAPRGADL